MYVKPDKTYDFLKLHDVTKVVTRNLNKIIEVNCYPVPEVCWTISLLILLLYIIILFVGRAV